MALRTASTSKTASDGNIRLADVNGLAISAIDTAIGVAADSGEYIIRMKFEANVSDGVITIKQSDESYVDIEIIVTALKENGYRASYNKRTDDGNYRLCLAVAWD
jgi:hypothetical protein